MGAYSDRVGTRSGKRYHSRGQCLALQGEGEGRFARRAK